MVFLFTKAVCFKRQNQLFGLRSRSEVEGTRKRDSGVIGNNWCVSQHVSHFKCRLGKLYALKLSHQQLRRCPAYHIVSNLRPSINFSLCLFFGLLDYTCCKTPFHQWGTHTITFFQLSGSDSVSITIVLRTVVVLQMPLAVYAAHPQPTYRRNQNGFKPTT